MTRILIGALSGWKYHERRQRCLSTWMADADALGVRSVFLLGCPKAVDGGRWTVDGKDIDHSLFTVHQPPTLIGPHALACPCPDDYQSLPQRTLWFCRWALGEESGQCMVNSGRRIPRPPSTVHCPPWDYLFKCDDDTYVSIPRLLALDLADRDYVGAEWKAGVGYGSGGAGYFLSRKAAAIVAEKLTQASGAEDLLVGRVLRSASVPFAIEPRLVPFGSRDRRPRRDNALITCHACEAAFLAAHEETGLAASACPQSLVAARRPRPHIL